MWYCIRICVLFLQDIVARLPKKWRTQLPLDDQLWIASELFTPTGTVVSNLHMWYSPPAYKPSGLSVPRVGWYHHLNDKCIIRVLKRKLVRLLKNIDILLIWITVTSACTDMVIYGSHLLDVGIFISLLKYIHLYSYILIPVPPAVF